jgi:hypothetical protein
MDEDGENVVLDAIHVLNSNQINLSAVNQECEDDPAADNADKLTSIMVKTRNKAIAEVSMNLVYFCTSVYCTYFQHVCLASSS